jgi:hypothetical protein
MKNPIHVIEDFCEEYSAAQTRAKLWSLIQTALMQDSVYNSSKQRRALLEWYNKPDSATEATYVLLPGAPSLTSFRLSFYQFLTSSLSN